MTQVLTTSPQTWLDWLRQQPAIAIIRTSDPTQALQMAHAVAAGGIRLLEITWNSAGVAELIPQLQRELPECHIGTGTLLDLSQLRAALAVGAEFLFMPHVDPTLITAAVEQGIPVIPGAMTPSEVVAAWRAGATCVKLFPIQSLGGVQYLQDLRGPLGHIPLIPTGGVTLETAPAFLQAGALAVGIAGDLFPSALIRASNWQGITERTRLLLSNLQAVRR
jgi:2-dehydro-3-deoxyphosphogluconate aldolase / (4S)-4-hydroxy-2-oxoglutarate aldolase